jgi:ABC-type glycerol-3-phosphate transport system substrate-binding protein
MVRPTDGQEFLVLSWNNEFPDMVKDMYVAGFGKDRDRSGMNYEGVTFVYENLNAKGGEGAAEMNKFFAGSSKKVDVLALEAAWVRRYIDSRFLVPLNDVAISEDEFADQYAYTKELVTVDGKMYASSFQATPGGWAYRTDLAETLLDIKNETDMQEAVKNWDEFKKTAEKVRVASDSKTAITATVGGMWEVFSAVRTTGWVDSNKKLQMPADLTTFLERAKDFETNNYVTTAGMWGDEWAALGSGNTTMGYFVSTWGMKDSNGENVAGDGFLTKSAGGVGKGSYGKWRLIEGPENYFWGGTWIGIHPDCDNGDIAADVIRYFTKDEDSIENYVTSTGDFGNNKKVMNSVKGTHQNNMLGGQKNFEVLTKIADSLTIDPSIISQFDSDIKGIFSSVVTDYSQKGTPATAEAAIADFKEKVLAEIDKIQE